tara:strand:- start:78 stop:632 length:555 start_codon:yes stop_codon:yes gene_type:complete
MIFSMVYLYKYKYKYIDIIDNIIKPEKTDNNAMDYNDEILDNLEKLKKYKKHNINEYNTGIKYYHKFMDNIYKLENRNLKHSKQYLENAKLYLNRSINHLQYITTSIPDRNLIDGIKYEDFNSTKKVKKLHKIIDDLYKISFSILFTLSTDKEKIFLENPNIYSGHVNFVEPEPSNSINHNELY